MAACNGEPRGWRFLALFVRCSTRAAWRRLTPGPRSRCRLSGTNQPATASRQRRRRQPGLPFRLARGRLVAWIRIGAARRIDCRSRAQQRRLGRRRRPGPRGGRTGAHCGRSPPALAGSWRHGHARARAGLRRRGPRVFNVFSPAVERKLRAGFLGQEPGAARRRARGRDRQPLRSADHRAHGGQQRRDDVFPGARVARPHSGGAAESGKR